MSASSLLSLIKSQKASIGVIGLGYVGLPLAVLFAKKGFRVTGFGRDEQKIEFLKDGNSGIESVGQKELTDLVRKRTLHITHIDSKEFDRQDVYFVCVPTPVDERKNPDLTAIRDVARRLSLVVLDGKLIINESTVAPGTTREKFGNLGGHYFLSCSPERIDPGNKTKTVATIAKVVGGIDAESQRLAKALYAMVLDAPVVTVSSPEVAETVKMLENTYRAVNIALINEVALLCETLGVDVLEVISAASTKWSFQPHYPGIGVGGHCIPVDPYYLLELGRQKKSPMRVVSAALARNNDMPHVMIKKFLRFYKKGMAVLVYGLTYKKDVSDLRESPAVAFCHLLKQKGIVFRVYDPMISRDTISSLGLGWEKPSPMDILVVATDHSSLFKDAKKIITDKTVVIDGRNFFTKRVGKAVYGVGRTLV